MKLVLANEATAARRRCYFHLVDATDGITAETGEAAGQPQVSSDGGAFTNTGIGTLTHMGNGRYYADLTQALVATAGTQIETRYKSANTAESPGDSFQVVAFDPYDTVRLGLTALPNAAADAAGGLPISDAGGLDLDTKLANTNEITVSRMGALTDWIDGGRLDLILDAAATTTELNKVPKSDGTTTWNATALGSINSECDTAISDASLATAAELNKVPKSDGTTSWNATALAAINAECDTANTDYGANTTTPPTVVQIRQEMDSNSTQLSAIVTDTGTTLDNHLTDIKGTGFVKDTHSLPQCLTGSGGDATEAKQDAIITDLDDIKGTGFVKDTNSLTNLSAGGTTNLTVTSESINVSDS